MVFGSLEFTNGDVNGDVEAHFKDVNATGNLQVERMTGSSNVSSGDFHSLDDEFNLAEGVLNRMGADH